MDEKTYPLSVVSTLTGIKKSTLKILGEQQLIDIRYSHDRLDANKLGYEIHSKTKISDRRYKVISVIPIPQTELTRFQTWLEEHPEIERDLSNTPVIGIDQLIKDTGYSEMTILGMYQKGQINITGFSVNTSKKITSGCVTRLEYERLLDLSRSQQDKPTAEQLEATIQAQQEEIERLKAENEALKAEPTTTEKEENGKGFNTSLAIIHALYKMASEPQLKAISLTTTDIGRTVEPDAISNRLKNTSFKNK